MPREAAVGAVSHQQTRLSKEAPGVIWSMDTLHKDELLYI